jgi:hypothetical protein
MPCGGDGLKISFFPIVTPSDGKWIMPSNTYSPLFFPKYSFLFSSHVPFSLRFSLFCFTLLSSCVLFPSLFPFSSVNLSFFDSFILFFIPSFFYFITRAQAFGTLLNALHDYVKAHHTTGPTWNPNGGTATAPAAPKVTDACTALGRRERERTTRERERDKIKIMENKKEEQFGEDS